MNIHQHPAPLRGTQMGIFEATLGSLWDNPIMRWLRQYALALITIPLVAAVSFFALSQSGPPSIPAISLSADPLYASTPGDKPVMALALSVEFPTVGAQYVDPDNNRTSSDPTYSSDREYLGYYDAESCYTYNNAPSETPATGLTATDYKRFVRRGPAIALATPNTLNPTWTTRMCWNGSTSYTKDDGTSPAFSTTSNDAFSGNFLNWASSSAIDMLRLALTGGDRLIDTPTLTVLQRAVIPDGNPIAMGNSSNFPQKRLFANGTSRAITSTSFSSTLPSFTSGVPYFGAVPSSMVTAAGSNDIYVANTLNRIYFGTTGLSGQTTSNLSGYTLGSSSSGGYQIGTVADDSSSLTTSSQAYQIGTISSATSRPSGTTLCASQNGTCTLPSGTYLVWYGKSSSWKSAPATGAVPCTRTVFVGGSKTGNQCYYQTYTGTWTPPLSVTSCASEGGTCTLPSGTWEVWYGANNSWKVAPATGAVPCSNGVFGDPASGIPKGCYYRAYSGSWTPTTAGSPLNSDGYFFARVQVCDRDSSTYALKEKRYWSLCSTFSDGASTPHPSYKPIGVIQSNADKLRLAAFGYLMDQYTSRYGGVLRAPMKYVGTHTFDNNGIENTSTGGNTNQEWNPITGVFYPNPDANSTVPTADSRSTYLSGVINYVNQFGRTGSVAGRYKKYDPVGELYYQALRYLQGLQPSTYSTSNAINGLPGTTSLYDGYPAFTTWTDPYGNGRSSTADYSCNKTNIVVIGDINAWDYNSRLPLANAANNVPDIAGWQTVVSKFESNTAGTYLDSAGVSRTIANPNTPNSAGLTSASGSVSIVGAAYWAHTHDIRGTAWTNATTTGTAGTALQRPGLRVKSFFFDVNEYGGSNSATTRRSSNQYFRAAKYGGFETDPSNQAKNPYNTWGNPFINEATGTNNNFVWQDTDTRASRVGEANTYYLQSDARGVLSAFVSIFDRATTQARSIAGGAIQSKNLTQVGDTIYQGSFDTSDWSGDLLAIPVAVDTSNVVTIGSTNNWTAATVLNNMATPAASRNIIVGQVGALANPVAKDFTWANVQGTSLEGDLNKASPGGTADGLGSDRLNYLRGDKSKDGSPFRKRNSLLGDIINSGVVYSGAPSTSITSSTYTAFYNAQIATTGTGAHAARTPALFVGANDGMLHAFNATNGSELFAYIPSWLGPKLSALTSPTYLTSHQSYVDATPAVAEAEVGSAGTAADWKTVLVGGTGGGGQGVFALDVTTPSSFSASNVMWEFTHTDDPDMGNVMGRPQILKFRTSAYGATPATYKWFAMVASGVNNYVTDSTGVFSSTGNPALFLLALDKAVGDHWTLGTNYYKISIPVDSTLSATNPTGLINFRAALGAPREVTQVYMGDLHGKFWKLDFSLSSGTSQWDMNHLSAFNKGTTTSPIPYPMYIAQDASGNVQPITMAPSIAFGPTQNTSYIFFGTGKFMEIADKSSTTQQSVYMLYDDNTITGGDSSPAGASAISGRRRLRAGTNTASTGVISVVQFVPGRATTNTDDLTVNSTVRSGWYFDFATSGERQISSATIFNTNIVFGSLIPGTTATSTCSAAAGGGNQYTVDIVSGNGTAISASVGILGEPLVAELTSATTYTPTDSTGRRIKAVTSQIFQQGSSGISVGRTSVVNLAAGRLSWRQINNYQDRKAAP